MSDTDRSDEAAARCARARAAKPRALANGLRFEVTLPPRLAIWVLDYLERGEYADPNEAVCVMLSGPSMPLCNTVEKDWAVTVSTTMPSRTVFVLEY